MGFGSAVSAMNTTLKNNRNLLKRKKREKFKKERSNFNFNQDYQYKKVSKRQILDLRQRLQEEKSQSQRRFYLVFGFVMVCIISFIVHYLFL